MSWFIQVPSPGQYGGQSARQRRLFYHSGEVQQHFLVWLARWPDVSGSTLNTTGCCRWYDVESRVWVAAKYRSDSELAEHEAAMLEQANKSAVLRVIKLKDALIQSSDSQIMVVE